MKELNINIFWLERVISIQVAYLFWIIYSRRDNSSILSSISQKIFKSFFKFFWNFFLHKIIKIYLKCYIKFFPKKIVI
jgi:hypothetical protein